MADNLQYIPQTGGASYVDWSKNITPIIQSWVDLSKYKKSKEDQLNLAILPALINAGWLGPTSDMTKTYPGLKPITGEERTAQTGKSSEMMKNYYDAMLSMQKASWLDKMSSLVDNTTGSTAGYDLIPAQLDVSSGGPNMSYMFNPKTTAQPGLIDRLKSLFAPKAQGTNTVATNTNTDRIKRARTLLQSKGYAGSDSDVTTFLAKNPNF
jgi:hypothetical protein